MLTAADLRSTPQAEMSPVWDYDKRSAEVDAERLQNVERNRPLAQAPVKPRLDDPRATATQLELFELVGRDTYDFVEQLIRRLPSLRQREHFRKLYLREYHGVQDDGSLAFAFGERQRFHANTFLRELLEERLGKVFSQYRFDLAWLSMTMADKWQWAMEQGVTYRNAINAGDGVIREREGDNGKNRLPFYLMTENKLKVVGHDLSYIFSKIQTDFFTEQANSGKNFDDAACDSLLVSLYRRLGLLSEKIGLSLPYWATFSFRDGDDDFVPSQKSIEIALNKSACETYWFKALRKSQRQMVEHLAIACGEVRKGVAAFISDKSFGEWRAQKKKNFDFLNGMILQNVDDEDEQVELIKMYERSSTNPSIRYQEMMNCLNGIEQWADENNHQALFLTLTAPSSFHAQHSKGGENKKWSGASPKQTQAYLNKVWAQYRAILKKRAIKFYGMRVAEPHHDGTPHWHLLVYVAREHAETVAEIFRKKALEVDGDERGASQHRCKVEFCDKQKGSATAYIVKYISKNLGGTKDRGYISDEIDGLARLNFTHLPKASDYLCLMFLLHIVSKIPLWAVWNTLQYLMNTCNIKALTCFSTMASLLKLTTQTRHFMKKYKFTIHFMLKSSKNTYSTELLIPAQMIDNNELGNLDALIGEKAMRKAILDVSAIGEFTVVPQIQQGKEVNDIFFKMKILGFYTEIIHFSMSAPKWENLDQMERWGYMIEQYFEQLEWQVETTQIEE